MKLRDMREMIGKVFFQLESLAGAAAGAVASFVMPIAPFLIFTVFLVVADTVTGIRAAVKRKDVITSRRMARTLEKICLYFVAILLAKGVDDVFTPFGAASINTAFITAGIVAATEFKSNMENISSVTGAPLWSVLVARLPILRILGKKEEIEKPG